MSKYENKVTQILQKEKIWFYREKTFKDLKRGLFRFDFYLPNLNGTPAIIEVDGEQHFQPIYGSFKEWEKQYEKWHNINKDIYHDLNIELSKIISKK